MLYKSEIMKEKIQISSNKSFGIVLGKIVSTLVMGVIFFLFVTPIGFFMRAIGKDLLNLKYNKNKSYWIEKSGPKSKMKNQF